MTTIKFVIKCLIVRLARWPSVLKVLDAKPGHLCSITKTHVMGGKNFGLSSDFHLHALGIPIPQINVKKKFKK